MRKIKTALGTVVNFVLIGVVILGIILIVQNMSVVIEQFRNAIDESIFVFITGAIALKIAQILRLCQARKIREIKSKKARKKAVDTANVKVKAKTENGNGNNQ